MTISSRTPEGEPALCPLCDQPVRIEPSLVFNDAPCPFCGSLLWFVRLGQLNILVSPGTSSRQKGLARVLAELLGVDESALLENPQLVDELELDSLDWVEIAMQLEREDN